MKLTRFKAEPQGTAEIYWNVLDTWYEPNNIVYRGHKKEAKDIERDLNSRWWQNGPIRWNLDWMHDSIMDFVFGKKR